MCAASFVAGVVAELEKIFNIRMPRFKIDAASALALAALINGRDRRIQCLQPRHDAIRMPVCPSYQGTLRSNPVIGDADAARKLREHGDIGVLVVNAFEAVLRGI